MFESMYFFHANDSLCRCCLCTISNWLSFSRENLNPRSNQSGKLHASQVSYVISCVISKEFLVTVFPAPNKLRKVNDCSHRLSCTILTMSLTLRCPPANTMALGGVATGNMKANEQEMVAGSMIYQG